MPLNCRAFLLGYQCALDRMQHELNQVAANIESELDGFALKCDPRVAN